MYLYNITLQRATGITHAIHGNFSGSKHQEVVVSRGKLLDVLRPDPNTGKVVTLLSIEVFGVVRSLMSFRLTGGAKGKVIRSINSISKSWKFPMIIMCKAESMKIIWLFYVYEDVTPNVGWIESSSLISNPFMTFIRTDYIVVGSDSGRIVILEYNAAKNALEKVHQETFGKSGCRRIVPGQYLAIDPKGRAVMISKLLQLNSSKIFYY